VGPRQSSSPSAPWARTLISHLWGFSISLWKFRNGFVHGHTKKDSKEKEFEQLHSLISAEFALNAQDRFLVSSQFSYLFKKCSLHQRLAMDRASMSCWLRTIAEASNRQWNFRESFQRMKRLLWPRTVRPHAREPRLDIKPQLATAPSGTILGLHVFLSLSFYF